MSFCYMKKNTMQHKRYHHHVFHVLTVFLVLLVCMPTAQAKQVAIVMSSDTHAERDLTQRIKSNASALVKGRDRLSYQVFDGRNDAARITQKLKRLQADAQTDMIVTTGFIASQQLANFSTYKKPSIAGIIFDEGLQRLSPPLMGRSGVHNFTFVKSNINIASDLRLFNRVYPYKKLGMVLDSSLKGQASVIRQSLRGYTAKPFELIFVNAKTANEQLKQYQHQVDALYVLPLFSLSDTQLREFFTHVNKLKLPSFALQGRDYTKAGALASQSSSDNREIQARRIALNIMKIVEGQNAASLPVVLPTVETDFVINQLTANTVGVYPDFAVLQAADVINRLDSSASADRLTVFSALDKALQQNLDVQKIRKEIDLSHTDLSEAKRAFLPSLNIRYLGQKVDDGFKNIRGAGITNTVSARASQVLFADEAIALYKARKMGLDANVEALKRAEYDVVFDVMSGYFRHFNAKGRVEIQRQNTELTRQHLKAARRKAAAGYSGKLDVHRLESELANNQATLNKEVANFRHAGFALKKLLNIEMNADVSFEDIQQPLSLLSIHDDRLFGDLNNQKKVRLFTDYLMDVAMRERPAIMQYNHNIQAQKTLAAAERRKWFMPVVSVAANANKIVSRYETTGRPANQTQPEWDVNLVADIPIFDRLHATNVRRTAVQIDKLALEREDLVKSISLGLHSDMQTAIASYTQMQLHKASAKAAKKNYDIVSTYYKNGRASVTDLIDAQSNMFNTNLHAINSEHQFFVDYLKVEKDSGFYYFLAEKEKQDAFVSGFLEFAQQHSSQ